MSLYIYKQKHVIIIIMKNEKIIVLYYFTLSYYINLSIGGASHYNFWVRTLTISALFSNCYIICNFFLKKLNRGAIVAYVPLDPSLVHPLSWKHGFDKCDMQWGHMVHFELKIGHKECLQIVSSLFVGSLCPKANG